MLLTLLLACSQTVVALDRAPSGYPIIGAVVGQGFNDSPPPKPAKYRVVTRPQHGTVTLLDELAGIYQYQSHPGYVGVDSFSLVNGIQGEDIYINVTESVQYEVTKTEDTQDGFCDADCSLSEAVEAANASPGMDVIVIPAGQYPIHPKNITDHVIIDGEGIGQTSLLGNGFRTNGADLQLSNLSYIGNLFDPNSSGIDPFIVNVGNSLIAPSLYRVKIAETIGFNSLYPSLNGIGKMLAFESEFLRYGCGAVLVGNEIIASRIAITEGGISNANCLGHTAFVAIATQNYSMPGTINLSSSSIHNNFSMPLGLIGIWPGNTVTSFNMINTSIHNNAGNPFGALIQMWGAVEANIINSTVVGNSDAATFYAGFSTTVWLTNNILAHNNVNVNVNNHRECSYEYDSEFISRGSNFFTNPNGCNLHQNDIVNNFFSYDIDTDPYLPLEHFQYIVPSYYLTGIIDGADNDYCPHVDIQGFQRPFGDLDGDLIAQCDIGAYEALSKKLNILANADADYLVLNTSDLLTLTITLGTKDLSASAEWWVYADTPMGPYYFNSATNSWQPGQGASYQQGILEFTSQQTIPVSGFPEGLYKFYFSVDNDIDGWNLHVVNAAEVEVLLVAPKSCDANGDDNIDRNDIVLIMAARNTPATGSSDPRDNDGDGTITVLDARQCVLQCDLNHCEIQEL